MQIKIQKTPSPRNPQQEFNKVFINEQHAGNFWKPSLPGSKQYLVSLVKEGTEVVGVKSAKDAKKYIISCYGNNAT